MTPAEADEVLEVLSAGFPAYDWPDERVRLWRAELADVGPTEGRSAAQALIRTREFLSFAAFFDCLAVVREHHLDVETRRPDYDRPALKSGERETPPEEAAPRFAELLAQLATCTGPLARSLGTVLHIPNSDTPEEAL